VTKNLLHQGNPNARKKNKTKTKSVVINNLPPNEDITGTPNASMNNQSVTKNMSLDNVGGGADLSATTHGTILNNNGIATALSTTVASNTNSLGVSTTITAATANATVPGDAANVKSPKTRESKETSNNDCITHLSQSKAQEISS
jgi:hypothetical protein